MTKFPKLRSFTALKKFLEYYNGKISRSVTKKYYLPVSDQILVQFEPKFVYIGPKVGLKRVKFFHFRPKSMSEIGKLHFPVIDLAIFSSGISKIFLSVVTKSQRNFLASTPSPHNFSDPYWPPELCRTREHTKIKKFFLQNAIFHFLLFFPFFALDTVWIWVLKK